MNHRGQALRVIFNELRNLSPVHQASCRSIKRREGRSVMAKRIVEGLWDCPYCGTKAIGGLTKTCPCCGHPQDVDTRFYLGNKKKYLEANLAAEYGQGPDWVCPYCGSLNRIRYKYCSGCGAPKGSSEDDYFTNSAKADARKQAREDALRDQTGGGSSGGRSQGSGGKGSVSQSGGGRGSLSQGRAEGGNGSASNGRKSKMPLLFVLLALAILGGIIFHCGPRNYTADVEWTYWVRQIDIEAWRTVQESAWSVPEGGRVYDRKSEIHHYDQVLDHYETRSRTVSESVYDGEDTYTSYVNNGDGTFSEETYSTPRYRTEYHTEYYQEPIYRDEPVYRTKYYYDIERWVVDRTEESNGVDNEPYWPEYTLAANERTGYTGEIYGLSMLVDEEKKYRAYLPLESWTAFKAGDQVKIKVVGGKVKEINGIETEERG